MVRGKFKCSEKTVYDSHPDFAKLVFRAVCQDETPENQRFHEATPSGQLEMMVNNPAAVSQFAVGKSYYLDFTEAPN